MSKNKPIRVMMKIKEGESVMLLLRKKGWRCWRRYKSYARRSDAEQAISNIKDRFYFNKFDFEISEK